jgi:hypothetical protein
MTLELGIWTLDNNYHSTLQMTLLMQNLLCAMLLSDHKFSHRNTAHSVTSNLTGQHLGT